MVVVMMDDSTIVRLAQQAARDELAVAVFTVNELGRFAALAFEEQTKTPPADRGMFEFTYECSGVELVCQLDYERGHAGSYSEPPEAEYVCLENAFHRGINIAHLLSDEVVSEIEEAALDQIKEQQDDF
jgi:hypothetical protein